MADTADKMEAEPSQHTVRDPLIAGAELLEDIALAEQETQARTTATQVLQPGATKSKPKRFEIPPWVRLCLLLGVGAGAFGVWYYFYKAKPVFTGEAPNVEEMAARAMKNASDPEAAFLMAHD